MQVKSDIKNIGGGPGRGEIPTQAHSLAPAPDEMIPLSDIEKQRRAPHGNLQRGQVYFISRGDAIKIGFSRTPRERLAALQTQHPEALELMAAVPGTVRHERSLHQKFDHLRITGEWFQVTPELSEYVDLVRRTGRTAITLLDEAQRARKKLHALGIAHRDKIAVASRTRILVRQMANLERERDPVAAAGLRAAIADTTKELAQVMRDGGVYIDQNHRR